MDYSLPSPHFSDINIFHFQSAHNFRDSAFAMLNDPETLSNLEAAGLKFIQTEEYEIMKQEINTAQERIEKIKEEISKREQQKIGKSAELGPLKEELDKTLAESTWGYHQWCGKCPWGGAGNCDARKQYFMDEYGHTEVSAKFNIIKKHPKCKSE